MRVVCFLPQAKFLPAYAEEEPCNGCSLPDSCSTRICLFSFVVRLMSATKVGLLTSLSGRTCWLKRCLALCSIDERELLLLASLPLLLLPLPAVSYCRCNTSAGFAVVVHRGWSGKKWSYSHFSFWCARRPRVRHHNVNRDMCYGPVDNMTKGDRG